jgi:hypothetical protein
MNENRKRVPTAVSVDLTKMMAEYGRMLACELRYDPGYLEELIEIRGQRLGQWSVSIPCPACEECGGDAVQVECPECELAPRDDCPVCDGYGRFWTCGTCEEGL